MARKKLSKGEMTKEIRRVLLKYQVDLGKMFFSASMSSIYVSGSLIRNDGKEFNHNVVFTMTDELLQFGNIRSELENWVIGADGVYFTLKEEKNTA